MRIATAFSGGFGSVELALKYESLEHEVVFACEWKNKQRESYLTNHIEPTSNFYKDIRDLDGTKYKDDIDYYHLSPPCQSYSMAGSRGGADDERGGLMFEAIKSIDEVQPKMFSVENVRGLISSNNGEDWKNILKDFKSLKGYTISWGIMNAKEQGTPQNRERVFIVGFRGQAPGMSFPQRVPFFKEFRDILEYDVSKKYYLSERRVKTLLKSKRSIGFGSQDTEFAPTLMAQYAKIPTDGFYILVNSNTTDGDSINFGFAGSKTRRGRVGKKVSQTLDTSCTIAVAQEKPRRLTPRECARVQGDFNDMFNLKGFSDTKLYEFIGNAMDISSTRNLILRMLKHCEVVKFSEPEEPSFSISEKQKLNDGSLF